MGPSARVLSVEALEHFHAALARFGAKAREVLGSANMVISRAIDDLNERHRYWLREMRDRTEEQARIRSALSYARMRHDGKPVGCGELELELSRAIRRQREAEAKFELVRRWQNALPEAVRDYEGPARKLSGFLESDLRQALALLLDKVRVLEEYMTMAAPAMEEPGAAKVANGPMPIVRADVTEPSS